MILPKNLHADWVNSNREKFHADPIIIEKVIRALVLLETLQFGGLNFIFKGGTSLMLMIQEPRRFSIDIDDKDKNGDKVERTYWHPVIVKNGLVNVVENYITKGKEIAIEGKLTNRSWDDKDGKKHYVTEIMVNELLMLSK